MLERFRPFATVSLDMAQAPCAECNSTLGVCGSLTRWGTEWKDPALSQAELRTLRVPGFKSKRALGLAEAFRARRPHPGQTVENGVDDDMRECLGQAASQTKGMALKTIMVWRARIVRDPSVTNGHAAASCWLAGLSRVGASEGSPRCNSLIAETHGTMGENELRSVRSLDRPLPADVHGGKAWLLSTR